MITIIHLKLLQMKNYLKLIAAVFGVTIAIFSSMDLKADPTDHEPGGTCTLNTEICGRTSDGNIISGTYNE